MNNETLWTVVLSAIPGLLIAIAGLIVALRKQRVEADVAVGTMTQAQKEENLKLSQKERDHVVRHYLKIIEDMQLRHREDMAQAHAHIGELVKKVDECEDQHRVSEAKRIRLVEFLRYKGILSEVESKDVDSVNTSKPK